LMEKSMKEAWSEWEPPAIFWGFVKIYVLKSANSLEIGSQSPYRNGSLKARPRFRKTEMVKDFKHFTNPACLFVLFIIS